MPWTATLVDTPRIDGQYAFVVEYSDGTQAFRKTYLANAATDAVVTAMIDDAVAKLNSAVAPTLTILVGQPVPIQIFEEPPSVG